jgi:3-phosphoshikimate 1-carboxyvinyltransferase
MSLPEQLEIIPPAGPILASVTVPGSKSITNRALVLAALGEGETILEGALWSEDTQVMVEGLRELGILVNVDPDPDEPANRTLTVYGTAGRVPRRGSEEAPMELFVGNAGTAARFLAAMLCLGQGCYRVSGVPRMHERPQAALFEALRQLGYRIDATSDKLPAVIHGGGRRPGACAVSIAESSQFASALLLSAGVGGWEVAVVGDNADESPYVQMTTELVRAFRGRGKSFQIEPDASSGSYFLAADALLSADGGASRVRVNHWPESGWQADAAFPRYLPLPATVSRRSDLADSILTAMILAPFGRGPVTFTELGRLRVQECERVSAMRTELSRCGAKVIESGDTLRIEPSPLHGAVIETYGDHRIAMCFAVLGLKVPGIRLKDPGCVRKTFPNFFQKLGAAPPHGMGVALRDPRSGILLSWNALFAD